MKAFLAENINETRVNHTIGGLAVNDGLEEMLQQISGKNTELWSIRSTLCIRYKCRGE
jgi:hypothetical protein